MPKPVPDAIAIAAELLSAYDKLLDRTNLTSRMGVDRVRVTMAYGLCAQAYDVGRTALREVRAGRYGPATPLVREAFECAVHTQLLVLVPDASEAMYAEARRQRLALADSMAKAPAFLHHATATRESALEAPVIDPSISVRSFERICEKVNPEGSLYVMYRLLSAGSHAGVPTIERWIDDTDTHPYVAWRTDPSDLTQARRDVLAVTLALALLWSAAGLDVMLRTRPMVKRLDAAGAKLGFSGVLGVGKLVIRRR